MPPDIFPTRLIDAITTLSKSSMMQTGRMIHIHREMPVLFMTEA
jgi:hypothetical protein